MKDIPLLFPSTTKRTTVKATTKYVSFILTEYRTNGNTDNIHKLINAIRDYHVIGYFLIRHKLILVLLSDVCQKCQHIFLWY